MKLAILCGANPRVHDKKNGATIRLSEGVWKITMEGLVDSELTLHRSSCGCKKTVQNEMEITVDKAGDNISLEFTKRGGEDYISAFAELNSLNSDKAAQTVSPA